MIFTLIRSHAASWGTASLVCGVVMGSPEGFRTHTLRLPQGRLAGRAHTTCHVAASGGGTARCLARLQLCSDERVGGRPVRTTRLTGLLRGFCWRWSAGPWRRGAQRAILGWLRWVGGPQSPARTSQASAPEPSHLTAAAGPQQGSLCGGGEQEWGAGGEGPPQACGVHSGSSAPPLPRAGQPPRPAPGGHLSAG